MLKRVNSTALLIFGTEERSEATLMNIGTSNQQKMRQFWILQ
jgi:hypothetical protein